MFMYDFKFNLQLFAEGGDMQNDPSPADNPKDGPDNPNDNPKDSPDDGGQDVQSKINEAVKIALAKAKKDWQKEAEKKAKEQKRLEQLSADERAKEELKQAQKDLAAKEEELTRKELKLEMNKVLAERGIPLQFMDYLIDKDSESTLKRITDFEKEFKKAVKTAVDEKLKGKAPITGGGNPGGKADGKKTVSAFFDAIYKNQTRKI